MQLGPLLVCSLVGGALADGLDKRRLLLGVTAASMACSIGLALNASLDHPQLWLLYVLGAIASAMFAVSFPVLRSLLPLLARGRAAPGRVRAAVDLRLVRHDGRSGDRRRADRLVGLTSAYVVDVATYALASSCSRASRRRRPSAGAARASRLRSCEGLRFLRGQSVIMSMFAPRPAGDDLRHAPCSLPGARRTAGRRPGVVRAPAVVGGRGRVRGVAGQRLDGARRSVRAGRCCGPSRRGAWRSLSPA